MNVPVSAKRSTILTAAQKRFARFGLSKVTMDEIAGDLGMSKASLYYYFPTKEDVFREVVSQEQWGFFSRMEAELSKDKLPSSKLQDYILHQSEFFNEFLNLKPLGHESVQNV